MKFTDTFIQRPVLAIVVSVSILLIGLQALLHLPIRQYPKLTDASLIITTAYPGANADLIRSFITVPIETALASTDGVDTLTSTSANEVSIVTLKLAIGADIDAVMTSVLANLNEVQDDLPDAATSPSLIQHKGQSTALLYLSFSAQNVSTPKLTDYLARSIKPRLSELAGVAKAETIGGQTAAMRIWLNPERMAAYNVTPRDVVLALDTSNVNAAAGQIKGNYVELSVDVDTKLSDPHQFADITLFSKNGAQVRLRDIATVDIGARRHTSSAVFDGKKAVFIAIHAVPNANPIEVVDRVTKLLPGIRSSLPDGLQVTVAYDATQFIRASIKEVISTLVQAAMIVIAIIFLFLGTIRSTIVPIVTIPLSLLGSLALMATLGFSLNLLTLLAMVLAIGLVVDDAIVVVENIQRHIESGLSPFKAALIGAREIALPVIAMTMTLAAVYAPIGFVGGLTGALFREFAFTLAGAVIVSGVIALTLSPLMCSLFLRANKSTTAGHAQFFERLNSAYRTLLERSLNHRAATGIVLVAAIASVAIMFVSAKSELAPDEDRGLLINIVRAPAYANLSYLEKTTRQLHDVLDTEPSKAHIFTINGAGGPRQAFAGMLLKPRDQRHSEGHILRGLQSKLQTIPGGKVITFPAPPLPGAGGGTPFQFVVTTNGSYKDLARVIAKLDGAAKASGLFAFTDTDLAFDAPKLDVVVNRPAASRLGVSMEEIAQTLTLLLGGNKIGQFDLNGQSRAVVVQVPHRYADDASWLTQYQVRTGSGTLVPLSSVVTVKQSVQPNALNRFAQLNAATFSAVPQPGTSMGDAIAFMEKTANKILPKGYSYDFNGESRQYIQEGGALVITFAMALIVIFLVLAVQFGSFRDPLIILIALPTSMFGALLPITLGYATLNIFTQIGLVTLIGLIAKHGILMIDYANALRTSHGTSAREAIEQAATIRLRPVLMTTAAMVMATLPLMMATGAGANSRFEIGVVIASGMLIGTLFTLFVTPAVYTVLSSKHQASTNPHEASLPAGDTVTA